MDSSVDGLMEALKDGEDWESTIFEAACAGARELTKQLLEQLDERLGGGCGQDLKVEGYRVRTVLTRFGPVRVRRRLYRQDGRGRFLLDERLGWTRRQAVSPTLRAIAVELASQVSFRVGARVLGQVISQSVSATTLHRLVRTVGGSTSAAEERTRQQVYQQGATAPSGAEVAEPLFVEADGVSIALQRDGERRTELKAAIAYAGSQVVGHDQRRGRPRRRLVDKVTYAGLEPGPAFWDRAWLQIGARYDLEQTRHIILGGDGAAWVRGGLSGLNEGIFQLDRFHLARALRRVLGPSGMVAFQAARTGNDLELHRLLAEAAARGHTDPARVRELESLERYLWANHDGLVDWRRRPGAPTTRSAVPLGAMEAAIDKPFATRFKKRGMSWTRRGAHHMAKVLQLRANGQLAAACGRGRQPRTSTPTPALSTKASAATTAPPAATASGPPFQAVFVPRWGPHASRPWVQALCRLLAQPTIRSHPQSTSSTD